MPIQVIFAAPTVEKLALAVSGGNAQAAGRAIRLAGDGSDVVAVTYSPAYQLGLADKALSCRVEVWRCKGDGASFIEGGEKAGLDVRLHDLAAGHYALLKSDGIAEMLAAGLAREEGELPCRM